MIKTFLYIIAFSILILISCTVQGLTNDFGKLSEKNKSIISPLKDFENVEIGKIYSLNSNQLKKELKNHPKSIVYVFTNGCKTKYCLPMNVYKNYAEANGYKLFLVMNGYANLEETLNQMVEVSYFSIDNEFYNVESRVKYTTYFENELMNLPKDYKHKKYPGNLFFFENGEFKNAYLELPKK